MGGEAIERRRPTGQRWREISAVGRVISARVPGGHRLLLHLARIYRYALGQVVFLAVTGSTGKTTTKELIAAVLSARFRGQRSEGGYNHPGEVAQTILRTRPWHRYCVQEAAAGRAGPGSLDACLDLVKPCIGVVINVGSDHISAFGTVEAIAEEKAKVVLRLPRDGIAVLNADDPLVFAMRSRCLGRVITFGQGPEAMVRGADVESRWPERLSLTISYAGESRRARTRLCGAHWAHCVLAAAAVGLAMGLPLAVVVEALEPTEPCAGRMCPVIREDGVTFILDDRKSPLWTIPPALEFMREARADRKIVVLGTISDYRGDAGSKYVKVAREARKVADYVSFVGPWASRSLRARRHGEDHSLRAFATAADAAAFLRGELRSGDLVLVKGSRQTDRLDRIVTSLMHRGTPSRAVGAQPGRVPGEEDAVKPAPRGLAVVGLGNPGSEFDGTRHNVGQRVLDHVARALQASWTHEDDMLIARAPGSAPAIYLVKPLTAVNFTGSVLARASRHLGFGPADCILVHDDMSLAVGVTRVRMRGSDGGHRGVRSIIQAFQSDAFPRVKLGVGQPKRKSEMAEYVLTSFLPAERMAIESACGDACAQILRLVRERRAAAADGS